MILNSGNELGNIVIQIRLVDMGVRQLNVLDECTKVDAVESFVGVVEDGVVNIANGCGKLVMGDGKDKFVRGPCFACYDVVGVQFFALRGSGAVQHDGVCWWFVGRDGKRFTVVCCIDGGILK